MDSAQCYLSGDSSLFDGFSLHPHVVQEPPFIQQARPLRLRPNLSSELFAKGCWVTEQTTVPPAFPALEVSASETVEQ